jgi:hypothetical protein
MADSLILIIPDTDGTTWSHGAQSSAPWWHPQTRRWLIRCTPEAAVFFCRQAGAYIAPPEMQSVDK